MQKKVTSLNSTLQLTSKQLLETKAKKFSPLNRAWQLTKANFRPFCVLLPKRGDRSPRSASVLETGVCPFNPSFFSGWGKIALGAFYEHCHMNLAFLPLSLSKTPSLLILLVFSGMVG